jgi:hypothetical protein
MRRVTAPGREIIGRCEALILTIRAPARYGRYAIRIDATRRGVYPWLIQLKGRSIRKGVAPDRDQAADAVSDA